MCGMKIKEEEERIKSLDICRRYFIEDILQRYFVEGVVVTIPLIGTGVAHL